MFIFLLFVIYTCICFLGASGKKDALPRFIMEDTILPPIFGSYNYDPIKQLFDIEEILKNETIPHDQHNIIQNDRPANETALSTKTLQFLRKQPLFNHSRFFRKHVSVTKPTNIEIRSKLKEWWTPLKSNSRNATKSS